MLEKSLSKPTSHWQQDSIIWNLIENQILWFHVKLRSHPRPAARLIIQMSSYQYRESHFKDKTVSRQSYRHNGNSYHTGKAVFIIKTGPVSVSYQATKLKSLRPRTWVCQEWILAKNCAISDANALVIFWFCATRCTYVQRHFSGKRVCELVNIIKINMVFTKVNTVIITSKLFWEFQ